MRGGFSPARFPRKAGPSPLGGRATSEEPRPLRHRLPCLWRHESGGFSTPGRRRAGVVPSECGLQRVGNDAVEGGSRQASAPRRSGGQQGGRQQDPSMVGVGGALFFGEPSSPGMGGRPRRSSSHEFHQHTFLEPYAECYGKSGLVKCSAPSMREPRPRGVAAQGGASRTLAELPAKSSSTRH